MSNFTKNILWAVLTLIVVALLFSLFTGPTKAPTTLSLNQLVNDIDAGSVGGEDRQRGSGFGMGPVLRIHRWSPSEHCGERFGS